jgi:hypothetical protein
VTASITSKNLADRIADEISDYHVEAALFSTFTFRREFFERVPLPLVTDEEKRRGLLPITVIVDRTQFEGSGWGYEVVRAPAGRLWHAKITLLLISQQDVRRTVTAIGSGNLTRSGWEQNLELFHIDAWNGWGIPLPIIRWLQTSWLRTSAFARWARDVRLYERGRQHRSILGSLDMPLWEQLDFVRGCRRWSEAHVVSPFGDIGNEGIEESNDCGPFFESLLERSKSAASKLTVYLQSADDDGTHAFGDRTLLKRVSKQVDLRLRVVPSHKKRLLHAKLLAVRARGSWSVMIGSANATGAAFTASPGNVELGCEYRNVGRFLPNGLLPQSRAIGISALRRLEVTKTIPRWECLESAAYQPHRKRIVLRWKKGHSFLDSRVLLENRVFNPNDVELESVRDRFLMTIPLGRQRRNYKPDYVPITVPIDVEDLFLSATTGTLTADQWLDRLDNAASPDTIPGYSFYGGSGAIK